MGSVNEPVGIKGEVWSVLENLGREHTHDCPWWADKRAVCCKCGIYEVQLQWNIVTDSGDRFYAEAITKGITGTPATLTPNIFDTMTVATAVAAAVGTKTADAGDITTIPTGGTSTITSTYPKVSDPDTNNPGTVGVDIVTWKATYTSGNANGTLVGLCIHVAGATFGGVSTDPLLMSVDLSPSIVKGTGQSLTFFVNHNVLGV